MAARDPAKRLRVRHAAEPAIARVALHPALRLLAQRGFERRAELDELELFAVELRQGKNRAKRILFGPKVSDHRDAKGM